MASLKYIAGATFQTATLNTSYTSGGTSLVLTAGHGARFPSTGDFWVRVEDEIFKATSRSTDTLTVVGAQDGTSASNHASSSEVRWVLGVAGLEQLRKDLSGVPLLTRPVVADFTAFNQSSATFTDTDAGIVIREATSDAGLHMLAKAIPATPYTITMKVTIIMEGVSGKYPAIIVGFSDGTNAASSKIAALTVFNENTGPTYGFWFDRTQWTNSTTYSAGIATTLYIITTPIWFQLADDGVDTFYRWSVDGISFETFRTETRTTFLTPTHNIIGIRNDTSAQLFRITVESWIQS